MDVNYNLTEIDKIAAAFLEAIPKSATVAFHAEMGTGKTTFIHALCKALGVREDFGSPTFSIINEYTDTGGQTVFHIDLYRIKNQEEARSVGIEECFYSEAYCFVEWPENAFGLLPADCVHCYLSLQGENERNLKIKL